MSRGIVLALALSLINFAPAWAACSGSSPNLTASTWADVSACYAAAANGDTITVGPGTFDATTFTNFVSNKAITLTGSGTMPTQGASTSGGTTIRVNTSGAAVLGINESTAGRITVQNLKFTAAAADAFPPYAIILVHNRITGGQVVVMHHLTFEFHRTGGRAIQYAAARGVIYQSIFTNDPGVFNNAQVLNCSQNATIALASWPTASTYGTADTTGLNNLYFETNVVSYFYDATDFSDGCRAVVRYNAFTDSILKSHGYDSGAVGNRHTEVYNNTFTCSSNPGSIFAWVSQRGGTWLYTDNVFAAISRTGCNSVGGVNEAAVAAYIYKLQDAVSSGGCWPAPFSYPVTRQIGWGWSGGATTTQDGYRQDLEPTRFWNNVNNTGGTIRGIDLSPDTCGNQLHISDYFRQNRDWYACSDSSCAKPGYTKYRYPHPLVSQPSQTAPPAAPSSLRVR